MRDSLPTVKYKVGQCVHLKSKDWFDVHDDRGDVRLGLASDMRPYFGTIQVITHVDTNYCGYVLAGCSGGSDNEYTYTDQMIDNIKTSELIHRHENIIDPDQYSWDVITPNKFPEHLEKNYTPFLDGETLTFTDKDNNSFTLKEIFDEFFKEV
jgi:predicted DNA binding protein